MPEPRSATSGPDLQDLEAQKPTRHLDFAHVAHPSAKQRRAHRRGVRDVPGGRVGLADSDDPIIDQFAAIDVTDACAFTDPEFAVRRIRLDYRRCTKSFL
jgi:hypothetical protein